jgi:hypothetical protein
MSPTPPGIDDHIAQALVDLRKVEDEFNNANRVLRCA